MQTQAPGWGGKYKFGVNARWGLDPVNANLVTGPVNTRWGLGPVNANWPPKSVNTNWGPSKGPGAGKHKHPEKAHSFWIIFSFWCLIRLKFFGRRGI